MAVRKVKEKIEDTTKIRVTEDRINDAESLDISFVDGSKTNKEKILVEKKDNSFLYNILKIFVYILVISVLLVFGYMYIRDNNLLEKIFKVNTTEKKVINTNNNVKMDYNYLFIGDYHTDGLEFDDFYKPYVKVSNEDYTTSDIVDDLRDYVYVYNPTHVFIQLGINDFKGETSISQVVSNLKSIVIGIKNNRSLANIYVESIYPVGEGYEGINNDFIIDANTEIEAMCKEEKVNYIDIFSELSEKGVLKQGYTDDGIILNSDGYKKVFKVINRYIKDERD